MQPKPETRNSEPSTSNQPKTPNPYHEALHHELLLVVYSCALEGGTHLAPDAGEQGPPLGGLRASHQKSTYPDAINFQAFGGTNLVTLHALFSDAF